MSRMEEMERQKREKAAEKRRLEYVTPEWTSKRKKPVFDPAIWTDRETVDVLADYTDFHALNPHSVTPRPLDDVLVQAGKDIKIASPRLQLKVFTSEEDIESIQETGKPKGSGRELVSYSATASAPQPLSPDYTTPSVGMHGTFARVACISAEFERKSANAARYDNEDIWYKRSVKDGLETYHIDGDHTSVRLKPKKARVKSKEALAFEADAKWREEQYAKYKGGGPAMSEAQVSILEKLTVGLAGSTGLEKNIISPWDNQYKWTDYNKDGHLLDDFNQVDLERRLKYALECHEEVLVADETRKAKARADRIAAKRKLMGLTNPTPANSKPGTGIGSRLGSAQVHPGLEGIPEGDLVVQDLDIDDGKSYAGGSVSSIGGMTYQDMGSLDGDESALGPSLTSGSTYQNKKHGGDPVGQIDMSSGASQQILGTGSRRPSVDESTLQDAITFATQGYGGDDGSTIKSGSNAGAGVGAGDDMSQMTFGGDSQVSLGDGDSDGMGGMGMSVVGDSETTAAASKRSKKQKKLDGILASKGLKNPRASDDASVSSVSTTSSSNSLITRMITKMSSFFHGRSASQAITDAEELKNKRRRIIRDSEIVLSDDEEEKAPEEDDVLDKYDLMKKKLGGDEVLEKQADQWLAFAALVRKSSKRDTNMFDSSMDLPDAVEKNNLAKVVFLLAVGQNDPNMRANNDEPVAINLILKILAQDTITGSLDDDKNETPDRVKMFRVFQALVKFGVDLDTTQAKNGIPPLHLCVNVGNTKMIKYLLENGADVNLLSNPPAGDVDGATPLMHAAKFGYIYILADLIRRGANLNIEDASKRNVLHYSAQFGQTRASMFLLRSGHDKRLKDKHGMTAGALAEDLGFTVTGQAIMTYAVLGYKARFALEYFNQQAEDANNPTGLSLDDVGAAAKAVFGNASAALGNAGAAAMGFFKDIGGWFKENILGVKMPEKVNAHDAFSMVEDVEEGGDGHDSD